ncbi:MAG: AraC family transcriptional regulator [Salinivirgaceae bacterium]|jgi:AraC-like DNA-binding protein|nr:AraC family transcriptional regulator [Salinivirgaceae bacterium]
MKDKLFSQIKSAELAILYDYLPDVQFWIKDKDHIFRWVNKTLLENYALQKLTDIVGKTDYDFSPFYIAKQFEHDDKEVLKGKEIINRIEMVSSFDKNINFYMTNKRPIFSTNGEIIGTMGITQKLSDQENSEIPFTKLNEIVQYIHNKIQHPISINLMAEHMHCSISTLERLFKTMLQSTPMEFIQKIKMQYASKALINSDKLVSEIAFSLGYSDQSHFIRKFKKAMKETPFKYRQQYLNLKNSSK